MNMKNVKNVNRKSATRRIALSVLARVLMAGAAAGAADQPPPAAPAAVVSRYTGVANVPAPAGGAAGPSLKVEIKDLVFVESPRGAQVPGGAFYIAQLRSGVIDADVAGKKERHLPGDIWTVAAGEPMTITLPARRQNAQLRTISLAPATGGP
jgi:hypothetical protein